MLMPHRYQLAVGSGGGGDALAPIYAIDPNAKVWVHTRGISTAELDPVAAWETADGNATLIQATSSKRPVRYSDGVYWDGIDDEMTAHAIAAIFGDAHSVILSCRDISTANNIRTVWIAADNGVSTSIREHVSQNLARGTSALSTRLRVLLGGTATAETVDMTALYALGSSATFTTAYTSPAPSSLGTAEAYQAASSPTLLDDGVWPSSTFVPDLFTVGSQRLGLLSGPSGFWQGTLASIVVLTVEATAAQVGIIYDALSAEGAL